MKLLRDANLVILKRGIHGATVFEREKHPAQIPAYQSTRVFKIGSGDVFSAAFAQLWAEQGLPADQAADLASRAASVYVETSCLPLPSMEELDQRIPAKPPDQSKHVYLAAPFFTAVQIWIVEQLLKAIEDLGAKVFSPLHDVGVHAEAEQIASLDLAGLKSSGAVLAVVNGSDPGTLFEVGYARSLDIPVVALAEQVLPSDLTMLVGTRCEVVDDLCTATYRSIWAIR
jgi:nucleoside 2-deoxyribosyltransferase